MTARLAFAVLLVGAAVADAHAGDSSDESTNEITLVVGGQKVIPARGVTSYSEGVPGIIAVKIPDDNRLIVTGQKPGSTTLLLISSGNRQETYLINVFSRAPQSIKAELKTLLAGLSGIDVREVGGRLFLDGAVPGQDDLARIDRIVSIYSGQVQSLVVVDPARQRTNIKLDFTFVSFKKNSSHQAGVKWPANIGLQAPSSTPGFSLTYDLVQHAMTSGALTFTQDLFPSLDLMGIRGWAKVQSTASIITTNGGQAEYHTGGEVNVQIVSALGGASSMQKIPFGTVVSVTPRLDVASGLIVVTINAEQSDLNPVAGQPVPGRLLTQTKTNVHVKLGQSIMLSGFKQQKDGEQSQGLPLLMRIPILGYLFRTENASAADDENVLFITPSVIEHSSPENENRIKDALKRYEDYDG